MNDPWAVGRSADGYARFPVLDPAEVARVRARFDEITVDPTRPEFVTGIHLPYDEAVEVDRWLCRELLPAFTRALGPLRPFFGVFVSKRPLDGGTKGMHQDWSYTDERFHRAVHVWIPLVDVDADNGVMQVVPGSHRWTDGIRTGDVRRGPDPTCPHEDAFAAMAVPVPVRAGDALVFDPGLVHGSGGNATAEVRPALVLACVPVGVEVGHWEFDVDDRLVGHAIDEGRFYLDPHLGRSAGLRPTDVWGRAVVPEDFEPFVSVPDVPADAVVAAPPNDFSGSAATLPGWDWVKRRGSPGQRRLRQWWSSTSNGSRSTGR